MNDEKSLKMERERAKADVLAACARHWRSLGTVSRGSPDHGGRMLSMKEELLEQLNFLNGLGHQLPGMTPWEINRFCAMCSYKKAFVCVRDWHLTDWKAPSSDTSHVQELVLFADYLLKVDAALQSEFWRRATHTNAEIESER